MNYWLLLTDIGVLLGSCLVIGALFIRFGQSPITGYLIAGMLLVGPGSGHLVRSTNAIETISEIGVSLLLFSLGLEFSWQRLQSFRRNTIHASLLQVILTPFILGGLLLLFGSPFNTALTLGFMLTLSSTACVLRILYDRSEIDSAHGRNALAVLLTQDIAVVPFAIAVSLIGSNPDNADVLTRLGSIVLYIGFLIAGLVITLNVVAKRLLSILNRKQNREMMPLLTVVIGVGSALAAHKMGLSPAIGAFVAGILLAGSPFATQVRQEIASFKVVFLTMFFGSIGMAADPAWIAANLPMVLGVSLLVIAAKTLTVTLLMVTCGFNFATSIATGLALSQIGEFAFVLEKIGREVGALDESHSPLFISTALVSLIITPYLVALAPKAGKKFDEAILRKKKGGDQKKSITERDTIFVLGLGPAGQEAAKQLKEMGEKIVAIDLNREATHVAKAIGVPFFVGNAEHHEVLDHFGIQAAKLVIVALPGRTATESAVKAVRESNPHAVIIARARYKNSEKSIQIAGAHHTVCDETEVSKVLAEQAVEILSEESSTKRL